LWLGARTTQRARARAGDHTRAIKNAKLTTMAGGIMSFAKVRPTCLACKVPLKGPAADLCEHCRPKARAPPGLRQRGLRPAWPALQTPLATKMVSAVNQHMPRSGPGKV